ncbi:hypothetical protein V6N12_035510 [Hibiscus sabdariffa]|uniref:Uncharacterized protein n=1 Tax=Hibiscus sabdariffa TaxID=183260 RepID=A0ABR2EMX5_9ROSI
MSTCRGSCLSREGKHKSAMGSHQHIFLRISGYVTREFLGLRRCSKQVALQGRYSPDIGDKGDSLLLRDIVYKQDNKLLGLRDKPIRNKTLCRNPKIRRDSCPGRTRCLCRDIPFVILPQQIIEALA